jgi:hypothetical protein
MAQQKIEEEFIQKTKDLRMDFFKENQPLRLSEMERRYQNIEQYFQAQRAAKVK